MPDIVVESGVGAGPPVIAGNGGGGFVVAWSDGLDIQARIVRAPPATNPGRFQVNAATDPGRPPIRPRPAVAALPDDVLAGGGTAGFVVAWTTVHGVLFQRFAPGGNPRGDVVRVSAGEPNPDQPPAVASGAEPGFMVAWISADQNEGVRARRFRANGVPAGDEFKVNVLRFLPSGEPAGNEPESETVPGVHHSVSVAGLGNNSFALTWQGAGRTARLRIVAPSGAAVTDETTLDFFAFNGSMAAAPLFSLSDIGAEPGRFVVVHGSNRDIDGETLLAASVFGPDGTVRDSSDVTVLDDQSIADQPAVAPVSGQGFVVAWKARKVAHLGDRTEDNVKARFFPGGSAAFDVSAGPEGVQMTPAVATTIGDQGLAIGMAWIDIQHFESGNAVTTLKARILPDQLGPP